MFILAIFVALNMVQVSKDARRCQRADFKEAGCSIYVKMNLPKN